MTSGSSTCGYGKSTRPKEMSEPPEANSPIATGDVAVKDIGSVVDFILRRRNISRLNLLGWSWGTTLMATYTTQNPGKVEKLILYAPVWIRQTASLVQSGPGKLGAYRTVTREQAKERWYTGVPEEKKGSLIPPGWFDAWADATFATDPGRRTNEPAGPSRPERGDSGRQRLLWRWEALLRSIENYGADLTDRCGMGSRRAAIHGAHSLSLAGKLSGQTVR